MLEIALKASEDNGHKWPVRYEREVAAVRTLGGEARGLPLRFGSPLRLAETLRVAIGDHAASCSTGSVPGSSTCCWRSRPLLTFSLSFLVVADVIGRVVFNSPVKGTPEIVSMSIVIICFLLAGYSVQSAAACCMPTFWSG